MLAVFVVALCFAGAMATASDCCSSEDRREVQRQWEHVWSAQFTGRRVAIGQAVFDDLFEHNEGTRELFERVNGADTSSPEFHAHALRVINGLDTVINLLDDPATLDEQLHHLSVQHQAREGIVSNHFEAINESFLRVLPHVIPCFNPDAWNRCFHRISGGITEGLP